MGNTHWRAHAPTPAEVDAHAERHTFLRYEKDDPSDTSFTMPAYGLWMHRRPQRTPPECPRVVMLLRGLRGGVESMDRTGGCDLWTDGEWQPLNENGASVAWPVVTP